MTDKKPELRAFRLIVNGSNWQTVEAPTATAAAEMGERMWQRENGAMPHSMEARSE